MKGLLDRGVRCEHARGGVDDARQIGLRNDDDSGVVAGDEVARLHRNAADRHRLAEGFELEPSLAGGRGDGPARKPQVGRADFLEIAAASLDDDGRRATLSGRERSEASEGGAVGSTSPGSIAAIILPTPKSARGKLPSAPARSRAVTANPAKRPRPLRWTIPRTTPEMPH